LIEVELNKLNGKINQFVILANELGDYVQCAGQSDQFALEYRLNTTPKFKHYVLGRGQNVSPLKVNWVLLQTAIGAMRVHTEEVLNLNDAELIFRSFYEERTIQAEFNKRNVTKLHLRQK
jgi:hypothetical protein